MRKVLLAVVVYFFGEAAMAEEQCEVIGKNGATVFVYCPATMKIDEVTALVKTFGVMHFNKRMNQVHIDVFDDRKSTPKDSSQLGKMPDKLIDKHRIASYSENKNSKYFSYMCKKDKKAAISDCADIFKRE